MRILMLSHGYPPTISGVTLVVQKVARAMVSRGHDVTVVTASDRGAPYYSEDQGVSLRRVRSAPNPFWPEGRLPLLTYEHLKEIIDETEPDVINTHDSALLSWQLHRLDQNKSHVPEVLTCHFLPRFVTYYVQAGETIGQVIENLAWDVTLRMINSFHCVVFPTRTQESMFREEGLVVPSIVISNGLDTDRYNPSNDEDDGIERRYGLPPHPRVLFVGRLAKDKKIDVLLQALVMCESVQLILVGRGSDRQRLEELVGELGLRNRVHFMGFVPEEDLPMLYRVCDLFVIASDVEVQSIPTMQAAASGLPIIASNAASLPELVKDGTNGYLVPPDDPEAFGEAICRILEEPERASTFKQASLLIGRQHTEALTFQAYEELYSSVANCTNKSRPVQ
jgi:1,2-diacylglycerol 3-alpha-glucosyltransferase